ncbi:hypothetical protein [Aminobacter sp. SR38]|uniref:hypothetical protein n=1 Tax=Aminobacter sp. SR38 TaxID=2774562 RepID=UPI001FEFC586|nr:hypothetical protein [Aminobacter sp. SR38]
MTQTNRSGEPARMRAASQVMRPENLAAIQPSRFSGARAFMNRMLREQWDISIARFDVNANAEGTVVYSIKAPRPRIQFRRLFAAAKPRRTHRSHHRTGLGHDGHAQ